MLEHLGKLFHTRQNWYTGGTFFPDGVPRSAQLIFRGHRQCIFQGIPAVNFPSSCKTTAFFYGSYKKLLQTYLTSGQDTAGFLAQGKERSWRVGNSEEIFLGCRISRDWHKGPSLALLKHPAVFNEAPIFFPSRVAFTNSRCGTPSLYVFFFFLD